MTSEYLEQKLRSRAEMRRYLMQRITNSEIRREWSNSARFRAKCDEEIAALKRQLAALGED